MVNSLIIIFSCLFINYAYANEISSVTVFADRAEVTRKSVSRCSEGLASAEFSALPGSIDVRTLRGGTSGRKVIGVNSKTVALDRNINTRVADLELQIETIVYIQLMRILQ